MPMQLFSTPVECPHCGATVTDPDSNQCPECNALLREKRTPGRLAGVRRRYGEIRFLIGFLRFLAVIVLMLGALFLFFGMAGLPWVQSVAVLVGTVIAAAAIFATAAFFTVALDVEENTRAAFRMQRLLLEQLRGEPPIGPRPDVRPDPEQGTGE